MRSGGGTLAYQRGAALLLFFLLLFLAGAGIWLARANDIPRRTEETRTAQTLARAKDILLQHAVGNPIRAGWLPYPDRNTGGGYDGAGDCLSSFSPSGTYIVGRWPFPGEEGCGTHDALPEAISEPQDHRLWLAVSPNLAWMRSGAFDNNLWLTVRTPSGVITGVAAVIIAPGGIVAGQSRDAAAPGVQEYLEGTTVGGVNVSNGDLDLVFVQAPAIAGQFNDRLAYITRSELLTPVTQRVAGDIKKALDAFPTYPIVLPFDPEHNDADKWFEFWSALVTYTATSASTAMLVFDGCPGVTYQLDASRDRVERVPAGAEC